jgi:2-desacetyl-2-hydroxyethyl bacteriochlorophyllide A dehydrogenase
MTSHPDMKALQLDKPLRWQPIDIPEPPAPAAGEALVRVRRVGICGTDISCYLGKMPFFSYPRIPGHELGVEVIATGEGVSHVQAGDPCSVEPYLNCGICYSCRRGYTNCCDQLKVLGVMCDGGLTERLTLPARKLHPARHLTLDQCALVETLGIGAHAVERAKPAAGENVLIIGAGPIGLSVLEFVKLSGARPIVMDLSESRLAFVRDRMGVPDTLPAGSDEVRVEALRALTQGQLADVVIDATGHHLSMARAMDYAAFAGRVVFVGITQQNLEFPHAPVMHRRELTLMASRNALSRDFSRIISLIEGGKIDTAPWITHQADFDDVPDVFPRWVEPGTGVIKAMVRLD